LCAVFVLQKKSIDDNDPLSFYRSMSRVINVSSNGLKGVKDGFDRVETGDFAFLWDAHVIGKKHIKT